ncbi:hypothetical protein GQ53DRAFT_837518 [Thozetella sp. PMI_491]|nr:hypothetical protein GQ53DRAFT_837518 [Thozetella sp. PMI_491]
MARKNKAETEGDRLGAVAVEPVAPSRNSASAALSTTKKSPKPQGAPPSQPPPSTALIICRNKHWRYISSFHGPWLQLPHEILETLANTNYNTPRPRPIDPAVFFDLVKIRRLVDDATNLAVRAASGVASSALSNLSSMPQHAAAMLGLGQGGAGQAKLSRERKFRMREQATQKLSQAYHLDEIACSVATMQGASTLEDVATHVLQRNPDDPDAKYVHFFHEKIPSRRLAECTSLAPLNDIIVGRPNDGEPLRTRATVRVFKDDYEGAAMDLTAALQAHRFHQQQHAKPKGKDAGALQQRNGRKQEDVVLKEEDQPSSLEIQLLFQRAGVYLAIACKHVFESLPTPAASPRETSPRAARDPAGDLPSKALELTKMLEEADLSTIEEAASLESRLLELASSIETLLASIDEALGAASREAVQAMKAILSLGAAGTDRQLLQDKTEELAAALRQLSRRAVQNGAAVPTSPLPVAEPDKKVLEARKTVRLNAKRALRDYNMYLSNFEYSPDLPIEIAEDFARKVSLVSNGGRAPRTHSQSQGPNSPELSGASAREPHRVYNLSELFAATPPADLPRYPNTDTTVARLQQPDSPGMPQTTTETLSYHPLLTDALHSLLLCHCLIQTSPKELLRHAHMVARLVRLADGYPVFQASRSPARADWMDVIRRGENWIQLAESWENLCAPAPLPLFQSYGNGTAPVPVSGTPPAAPRASLKALPKPDSPVAAEAQLSQAGGPTPLADPVSASPMASHSEATDPQLVEVLRRKPAGEALEEEHVSEGPSYCLAVRARQNMASHNYQVENAVARMDARFSQMEMDKLQDLSDGLGSQAKPLALTNGAAANGTPATAASNGAVNALVPVHSAGKPRRRSAAPGGKRWSVDDGHEYLIITERAAAVARWVCEAPENAGSAGPDGKKRKKKPAKKAGAASAAGAAPGGGTKPNDVDGEDEAEA